MQRLFDTMTGQKQELSTHVPRQVRLYVCGPTVYDYSHLGHARVYVVFDTVVRYLRYRGYDVTYVRNYTDVDDKIIQRANESRRDPVELAGEFITAFQEDMGRLHVRAADVEPKVSGHITEIVDAIRKIEEAGLAYERHGTVYFSVRRHREYGKLSKRNLDELRSGARVEVDTDKENPLDFALWKAAKPDEPSWESPWGAGRPGWHIECSAMSTKYLGEAFDIHGGGMDLIFPHHENEIAQSEAAFGSSFARYWMHNGFVNLNQEKMAKSTGNFFTLRELFRQVEPEAIRLFLQSVQYRHPINFKVDASAGGGAQFPDLQEAEHRLEYFHETLHKLDELVAPMKDPGAGEVVPELDASVAAFVEAMDDDFNTAAALAPVGELFRLANRLLEDPKAAPKQVRRRTLWRLRRELEDFGEVLGLWRDAPAAYLERRRAAQASLRGVAPAWVEERIEARTDARRRKAFDEADEIRNELSGQGVELMDSVQGTRWRFV
ncbi:MAG: cysteine--tRNA ligase [bacterium]